MRVIVNPKKVPKVMPPNHVYVRLGAGLHQDQTISDSDWWDSPYAEFEDFVSIGKERAAALAEFLRNRGERFGANRLLAANGMEHGPRNTREVIQ